MKIFGCWAAAVLPLSPLRSVARRRRSHDLEVDSWRPMSEILVQERDLHLSGTFSSDLQSPMTLKSSWELDPLERSDSESKICFLWE